MQQQQQLQSRQNSPKQFCHILIKQKKTKENNKPLYINVTCTKSKSDNTTLLYIQMLYTDNGKRINKQKSSFFLILRVKSNDITKQNKQKKTMYIVIKIIVPISVKVNTQPHNFSAI